MPTPAELLQDPFVQELGVIQGICQNIGALFVQQGMANSLPFSMTPISSALNSTAQGAAQLTAEIALGIQALQQRVALLVPPVINPKGITPIGGGLEP